MMNMWFNLLTTTTLIAVQLCAVNAQTFTLNQPATGPNITCQGSDVTLQCVILRDGVATDLDWRRNETLVDPNVLTNHQFVFNSTYNAFTDLVITNVTLEDDNTEYECTATGSDITSFIVLNVTGPPSGITITRGCLQFIAMWDFSSDPVCGAVSYDVTISPSDGVMMMRINDTSYSFTELSPINYNVTLVGTNEAGMGKTSVVVSVPGSPTAVGEITTDRGCLNFTALWDSVTSDPLCGSLSYDVTISPSDGVMMMRINDTFYNFTALEPTNYTVTVAGTNDAGVGMSSSTVVSVPGRPPVTGLTINDACFTNATLSWNPFTSDPVCGPVSYDVTISPSDGVVMMRINETSYNFTGLTFPTNYIVSVVGGNDAGTQEPRTIPVNTPNMEQAVPSAVVIVEVMTSTPMINNSLSVTWDPASSPYCGEVLCYQVVISSDEHTDIPRSTVTIDASEMLIATFYNLYNETEYCVSVTAFNAVGPGIATIKKATISTPGGGDDKCFDKAWCIIVVVLCCILGGGCIISCTSSSFIFVCLKREEDSTTTINIFMVTIGICSFGTAIPVWYIYDRCIREKKGNDSSKDKRCFNILSVGSCGFVYVLNLLFDRPSKIKDTDAPDSQNMPLQDKDTNKPVRSAAEEQSLYSYARTGPINVVVEGGSSARPGDKPRQT